MIGAHDPSKWLPAAMNKAGSNVDSAVQAPQVPGTGYEDPEHYLDHGQEPGEPILLPIPEEPHTTPINLS